ncbi:rhodanese-like domain-containing protein [Methanocella arvoryzae]|uniref:Predicted rhodanese-like protein (Thiosulfate sulfurtransferase family) n=1 Tax=Methanocella arvoryzae (strain DSM 22066 / NBRC 105507 / MRE50) TaxID=351160 RepID=Q0W7K8_METAR|nr:rhodanese-like domain-containing protein [Methanocella arvoryzae]CAJ35635.1 predicted rhodanese-like protein (thiosulfate sulfurtransferase family) [Methanocella arvoryzae MRE50]
MALRDDICSAMESYMMNAPSDWNTVTVEELKQELASNPKLFLLDVRERDEFASGHIPGAVNISVREIPQRVKELPREKDMKIVAYCASGIRSAYATMFLRVYGYSDVRSLVHGIREWVATGNQIVA